MRAPPDPCRRFLQAAALVGAMAGGAFAQDGAMPRAWDGRPDLNGVWQAIGTAHWNLEDHPAGPGHPDLGAIGATPPGQGVVVGGEIPYLPEAREQRARNFEDRMTADPEAKCFLPGVPRATYLPYPFQIIQGDRKIMVVYGFADANRTIHMDKPNPEPPPIDSWMGRSHGRWEGDTLVVEAAGFNGQAWFDRAGNFAGSALRVEERYTPLGRNALQYEATMTDPDVFERPWKIRFPLYRRLEENVRVLEFKCVEYAEDLMYGHLRKEPTREPPGEED
ncbi:MAG: hypothetical protein OXH99_20805 [Bryobacterales bacterium]|nr:hypothetical protein [Bryobacterales bacterium]